MADNSAIEWTDATWNPTTGCTKISAGCYACYIDRTPPFRMEGRKFVKGHIPLRLHVDRLQSPLSWRKPRRVFVNSLSDLFHPDVPFEFVAAVYGIMAACHERGAGHTFQVLTKRPERAAEFYEWVGRHGAVWSVLHEAVKHAMGYDHPKRPAVNGSEWPLPNVWLGTSVENQAAADERIPHLLRVPAAVRFLSVEPLLEAIDLGLSVATCDCCDRWPSRWIELPRPVRSELAEVLGEEYDYRAGAGVYRADSNPHGALAVQTDRGLLGIKPAECRCLGRIDWAIFGAESGPKRRPCEVEWIADGVEQCRTGGVAAFVKQVSVNGRVSHDPSEWPEAVRDREFPVPTAPSAGAEPQ